MCGVCVCIELSALHRLGRVAIDVSMIARERTLSVVICWDPSVAICTRMLPLQIQCMKHVRRGSAERSPLWEANLRETLTYCRMDASVYSDAMRKVTSHEQVICSYVSFGKQRLLHLRCDTSHTTVLSHFLRHTSCSFVRMASLHLTRGTWTSECILYNTKAASIRPLQTVLTHRRDVAWG